MEAIEAHPNPFGGIVVNHHALTSEPDEFKTKLYHSIDEWKEHRYKVAWLEVPISKAALVPVAVEAGFTYHHASEEYLMLTMQLDYGAHVPPFASHYIGAGGVVISKERELLVVSERHRRRGRGPAYKLPGGALLPGEHLVDGVIREVLEETGVETKFEALVCFRHWHGYRYDKSDIYFVSRLSPLTKEIKMQEEELEECLWMPVDDFLSDDDIGAFNKRIVNAALNSPGLEPSFIEGYGDERQYEFFMPPELA